MPDLLQLYLFSLASLAILLIPGPAVLYVAAQSINQGRIAGIIAALGLECGTVFHVGVAALSISTLLPASDLVFITLKCFGTGYLIYLGVHPLLPRARIRPGRMGSPRSLQKIFWQGVIVEVLNPKTMLFFFAFLPRFVNFTKDGVATQILVLGFLFVGLATIIDLLYATLAASTSHFVREKKLLMGERRYVESGIYIGLGLITALSGSKG